MMGYLDGYALADKAFKLFLQQVVDSNDPSSISALANMLLKVFTLPGADLPEDTVQQCLAKSTACLEVNDPTGVTDLDADPLEDKAIHLFLQHVVDSTDPSSISALANMLLEYFKRYPRC